MARNGFVAGVNSIIGFVRGLPGRIVSALGNLGSLLWNAGKKVMGGLLRGIKSGASDLFGYVSSIAGRISNLKGPIEYDRVLLTPHGEEIINGLLKGLRARWPQVEKQLRSMTNEIPELAMPVRLSGMEALRNAAGQIAPQINALGALSSFTAPSTGGNSTDSHDTTVNVQMNVSNPVAERGSDTLARKMRTLSQMGAFS